MRNFVNENDVIKVYENVFTLCIKSACFSTFVPHFLFHIYAFEKGVIKCIASFMTHLAAEKEM